MSERKLTEHQKETASALGLTEEEYLKELKVEE